MKSFKKSLSLILVVLTLVFATTTLTAFAAHTHRYSKYFYNDDATYSKDGTKTAWCYCGNKKTVTAKGTKLVLGKTSKLTATQTTSSIKLSWKKVEGATGYIVYRKVDGAWKKLGSTKTTSYTISKLTSGKAYRYAVKAYVKEGGKTIYASKYTQLLTATQPKTPTTVKASPDTKAVKLTWSKSSGATGYKIYQYSPSKDKFVEKLTVKGKTTATVSSLKEATGYKFKVKPYIKLSDGKVVYGKASAACETKTYSAAKVYLTATPDKTTVKLSWAKVAGATGYRVSIKNGSSYKRLDSISAVTYTAKNLKQGTAYTFKVQAYHKDTKGTVTWGKYATVTVTTKMSMPTTTKEMCDAYNTAVNTFRNYQGKVVLKRTEDVEIQVVDASSSTMVDTINNVIKQFTGITTDQWTFNKGVEVDGYRWLYNEIPPYSYDCCVTPDNIVSASAKKSGDGYVVTLKIKDEYSYYNGYITTEEPENHKTVLYPLNPGNLDVEPIVITSAEMYYPGATVKAKVDSQGRLIKVVHDFPLEGTVKADVSIIKMSIGLAGKMIEEYEITYK